MYTMNSTYNIVYIFFLNLLVSTNKIVGKLSLKVTSIIGSLTQKGFGYCNRHRIISDQDTGEPYLERYYLLLKDRRSFPFNIFVHKFLKSDPDDLHDHPWSYWTFILRGGYFEHTPKGRFWRAPFTCLRRKPNDLHRIELNPDAGDCWTLFIPGKKERNWGFLTDDGWISHEKYNKDI